MSIQRVARRFKVGSAIRSARTARAAALAGLLTAVAGPVLLLTAGGNLPWHVYTIGLLVLTLAIVRGRYMFMLDSRQAEEISIRPRHR